MFFKKKKEIKIFDKSDMMKNIPKELLSSSELKKYYYGKNMPKISVKYLKFLYETQMKKNKTLLIRMFLRNGKIAEFTIAPDRPIFEYAGGMYVIDTDFIKEDCGTGYHSLVYHQDISIPLSIKIDVDNIYNLIQEEESIDDIVQNINPITLKNVVNSTVIQKVLAGGELEGQLQKMMMLSFGSLACSVLILIIIGYTMLR